LIAATLVIAVIEGSLRQTSYGIGCFYTQPIGPAKCSDAIAKAAFGQGFIEFGGVFGGIWVAGLMSLELFKRWRAS
jgi:hypothetical protein